MQTTRPSRKLAVIGAVWVICTAGVGCLGPHVCPPPAPQDTPRELLKTTLPPYVIEPPDELSIDAVRVVPKPPYKIQPLDSVLIQFPADLMALKKEDLEDLYRTGRTIGGTYLVSSEGTVDLGAVYGAVSIADLTIDKARAAVEKAIKVAVRKDWVEDGKVVVQQGQSRALQQIRGPHQVQPDGTVSLGTYGRINVAGMTVDQAKATIEAHLSTYLLNPQISLDISGFNSKVYYIIFDGGGFGESFWRLPITGNETVLDALGQVNGLPAVSSPNRIWVARPGPPGTCPQQLPVDLKAIMACGATATNYQLLPGDRIYVRADALIRFDNFMTKLIAPIQRTFGGIMIGNFAVRGFRQGGAGSGVGGNGVAGTGVVP